MKKTKFSRFFESLIYFILLTIPLISVFARVIYVQSNHEAYRSYYGDTINEKISNSVISSNDFKDNYTYLFSSTAFNVEISNFTLNISNFIASSPSQLVEFNNNVNRIYFTYEPVQQRNFIYFFNDNVQLSVVSGNNNFSFEFYLISHTNITGLYDKFIYYSFNDFSFLDNAFDYGIQKTIDDFGVGNINFLNWFGTMFSNNNNLLYINFVNMYLNYALWVSVGYLIYYFLNWFIRFVREILDNLIYKETKN